MKIDLTETESRHLIRIINDEIFRRKGSQSIISEIRLKEIIKKLKNENN